ncbi:dTMP kinase [Lampropedia puyangensis]|uniref:Thymidylate kinase n=1 Tax=Lampropedia puyangensis TaxID=1330072 RepID=A0A4S8FDC4_9BURK|nr:dTMP kinase [Lampropedia puyangensis]THU05299.1 dTMP kinase [Lampropedia puyangensis]
MTEPVPVHQVPLTRKGWFISVEGIDGAGKSSHIQAMATALERQGHEVVLTREPGGTPLGEKLRALLLHDAMDALTETLLAFAARRQHMREVIVPALARGASVVCDRFTDATFAYQGYGRGVALQQLMQLEQWVQGDWLLQDIRQSEQGQTYVTPSPGVLQPDWTLWFDVPPEVAAARLQNAREPDRFEAEARVFFERVAAGYAQRAAAEPQRWIRVVSDAPREAVQAAVLSALTERGVLRKEG